VAPANIIYWEDRPQMHNNIDTKISSSLNADYCDCEYVFHFEIKIQPILVLN
jgi:prophage DNA circulation protein